MNTQKTLFVAFSHNLTASQIEDAKNSLGITNIVMLRDIDAELQKQISAIPATTTTQEIKQLATKVVDYAVECGADYALLTGEPTLTVHMNIIAYNRDGIECVMSTTERGLDSEVQQPDGSVRKVQNFKHVQWRNVF